jgi:hypothetical protein
MDDHRTLLQESGLDLERHDQLTASQGKQFRKTFSTRKHRPSTMRLFVRAFRASRGNRVAELWEHRKQSGKAIDTFE